MTTHAEAIQAIHAAFNAVWPATASKTFDNVAPDALAAEHAVLWVEDFPEERQETLAPIGSRSWENRATVVCEIYVAKDVGTRRPGDLADLVRGAYRGKTLAGCIFRGAGRSRVGDVGQHYKVVVRCPFTYYHRA